MAPTSPLTSPLESFSHRTHEEITSNPNNRAQSEGKKMDLEPLKISIPQELQTEAIEIVNELRQREGKKPLSTQSAIRHLRNLTIRMAEIIERHGILKDEENYQNEKKAESQTEEIASWTRCQGGAFLGRGIVPPLLSMAAAVVPGTIGEAIKALASLSDPLAQSTNQLIEAQKQSPNFKKELYLNMASSKRQSGEQLKQLPIELQKLLQRLLDLEGQMFQKISRQ